MSNLGSLRYRLLRSRSPLARAVRPVKASCSNPFAVVVPVARPKFDEVHDIIERLSTKQADFLCRLPPDGTSIVTDGPEMRVLIRMLWLGGFRLVEVQGPVGEGEMVNLNKAGRVVASGLRRQRRGDPSPLC